jgi:hypothetical protein
MEGESVQAAPSEAYIKNSSDRRGADTVAAAGCPEVEGIDKIT